MTENKNGHHGPSAFTWGLLIGAVLATLLTTKKGRQILRDLTDLSLELLEDFIEEKTRVKTEETSSEAENLEKAAQEEEEETQGAEEDLASEITEEEKGEEPSNEKIGASEEDGDKGGNGHAKKRLFKGIKRK